MKKSAIEIIRKPGGALTLRSTIEIEVPEGTSLLEAEDTMQTALMDAGAELMGEFLHTSDADGLPIEFEGTKLTAKAEKEPLVVESTFGTVTISRWAYQSSRGGKCYYPLDRKMDLLGSATPKLARSVGFKHANTPAARVVQDLKENHGRSLSIRRPAPATAGWEMCQAL